MLAWLWVLVKTFFLYQPQICTVVVGSSAIGALSMLIPSQRLLQSSKRSI